MIKRPISKNYPKFAPLIIEGRILLRSFQHLKPSYYLNKRSLNKGLAKNTFKVYNFKSLLRRKLGETDPKLQESKVHNLRLSVPKFNNVLIKPGATLSFWKILGRPSYKNGFLDGMLLSNGQVLTGAGGGLCQLANLIYWLFLHTPVEITEHHHHEFDVFPDSGRTVPFGSGASVFYNYIDLQIHNNTKESFTLNVWMDDRFLHGTITSDKPQTISYKVKEEDHKFYAKEENVYRTNKLYKVIHSKETGNLISKKLITFNDSKVLYELENPITNLNT